jgi:hypothetical protein
MIEIREEFELTPRQGDPICCAPHGMGDLYAAQFVCVGFHSSPGDGARAARLTYTPRPLPAVDWRGASSMCFKSLEEAGCV